MSIPADNQTDNKMQFVSANYSDLEGDMGKPKTNTPSNLSKPATSLGASPTASAVNAGTSSSSTSIPMYTANVERISTLDEPVSVTITRDLKAVGYKFGHVFFPKQNTLLLRDWDLWVNLKEILNSTFIFDYTYNHYRSSSVEKIYIYLIKKGSIEFVRAFISVTRGQQTTRSESTRIRRRICPNRIRCRYGHTKHQTTLGQDQLLSEHLRSRLLSFAARHGLLSQQHTLLFR